MRNVSLQTCFAVSLALALLRSQATESGAGASTASRPSGPASLGAEKSKADASPAPIAPRRRSSSVGLVRADTDITLVLRPIWSPEAPSDGRSSKAKRSLSYSDPKGRRAMLRALLIATVSFLWCSAQVPNMRRGRILPLSGTKAESSFVSL